MVLQEADNELTIDCLLLAGRIMIESGAETYRVEDTMLRMAKSQKMTNAQCYATPTGIIFSLGKTQPTRITSISKRVTDLQKIALVNSVSRRLTSHMITLEEAYDELKSIQKTNYFLPTYLQVLAAALASGCFLIMFQGGWSDFPIACLAGGLGFLVLVIINHLTKVKFFSEFTASLAIGFIAFFSEKYGYGTEIDKIIISSVMPLVPGILITNAVRDLMAGHFMSGMAKGAEAFLTAFAIGAAIAVTLGF
ncbi:threonine/serine exporter family protein [Lysinibacillus macroides]|uniref:Membrane protein n=1 Tax=Lysinibacillus macroides TaxID=33935 RepID=A0A0N0UXL7_9BACI|nr:threonine/serine exporter family protein [Lysinibacillus macroides]KOY84084.1 membrane protein [Lysinibacillus macroides]QPR66853.1 threonine/serine exporter family protein [Lysinibacillus macroides]